MRVHIQRSRVMDVKLIEELTVSTQPAGQNPDGLHFERICSIFQNPPAILAWASQMVET
jgi:hypothetical protein